MVKNCVSLKSTGQVLRLGCCNFENDGQFNVAIETYTSNVSNRVAGIPLKYNKITGNLLVEMSNHEKTIVDKAVPKKNNHITVMPRGPKEILTVDGEISITSHSTLLSKGSHQNTSIPDGIINGSLKVIRTDSLTTATITCKLDQDIGAYISFSMTASGRVNLQWVNEGYYDVIDYKEITYN